MKIRLLYMTAAFIFCGLIFMNTVRNNSGTTVLGSFSGLIDGSLSRGKPGIIAGPPDLEKIFSPDHTWVNTLPEDKVVTFMATGDVMLGRSVGTGMKSRNSYLWPFEKTAELLSSADLTIINLEAPFVSGCKGTDRGMIFCADPGAVSGLTSAGVDIAGLANNHMANYGSDGINDTVKTLEDAGITPVNIGPAIRQVKGTRFVFLAYNAIGTEKGISRAGEKKVISDIKQAQRTGDVVVVLFHWGTEYVRQPDSFQKSLAHAAVDAGASLIIGNHPHWIQPVEIYKDKIIMYSHGNFVFDQEWSRETKTGVVGKYTFYDSKPVDAEFIPVEIKDYGQSNIIYDQKADSVIKSLREGSMKLSASEPGPVIEE